MLWVSDFTDVSTWQGFVCVAFIIDTFADKIVGWRVSSSPKTDFVLDALEQALDDRRPVHQGGLAHHSGRGGPYLSIRYIERLVDAGIDPSVDSIGGHYDNAATGFYLETLYPFADMSRLTACKPSEV